MLYCIQHSYFIKTQKKLRHLANFGVFIVSGLGNFSPAIMSRINTGSNKGMLQCSLNNKSLGLPTGLHLEYRCAETPLSCLSFHCGHPT